MSTRNPNSPRAARSDTGAASAGKPPAADRAPAGGTGPAVPPAGPDPIPPAGEAPSAPLAPDAGGQTIDLTAGAAGDGPQPAPPLTETSTLALAAATVIAETQPQDAARTLAAAAGSATEAPSLGTGALAEIAGGPVGGALGGAAAPTEKLVGADAGIPPGRFSATGAHGGVADHVPEGRERRPWMMSGLIYDQTVSGGRPALARPETPEALSDALAAGFDFEITSRQLNFRRAGVIHPITPTLRRMEDFTVSELALLRSEPLLVVRDL